MNLPLDPDLDLEEFLDVMERSSLSRRKQVEEYMDRRQLQDELRAYELEAHDVGAPGIRKRKEDRRRV